MSVQTFTTGQASVALGYMVTGKFIQQMGLEPAGSVKGNPIWNVADWERLKHAISEHTLNLPAISADAPRPAAAKTTTKAAKNKPAAAPASKPFDDDEEDDEEL